MLTFTQKQILKRNITDSGFLTHTHKDTKNEITEGNFCI